MPLIVLGLLVLAGCESEPRQDPAERALKDPMNYGADRENHDVSGGGFFDLNKDALRKDVGNVLSP